MKKLEITIETNGYIMDSSTKAKLKNYLKDISTSMHPHCTTEAEAVICYINYDVIQKDASVSTDLYYKDQSLNCLDTTALSTIIADYETEEALATTV